MRDFDPEAFYKMTVDFINQTENSIYFDLIKLHLNLGSQVWAAMVLTHEAIDLALFDKKNKEKILKRYHESLCLLQRK